MNRTVPKPRPPLLVLIPPPVLFVTCFAAGLVLDQLLPWSPGWMHGAAARWVGWLLLGGGAGLAFVSIGLLHARRTTVVPARQPVRLLTDGPFALSRNPIYIAVSGAYCGFALLAARAWPLLLLLGPLAVLRAIVVPFEERRLRETFGDDYAAYCRRVRRWI